MKHIASESYSKDKLILAALIVAMFGCATGFPCWAKPTSASDDGGFDCRRLVARTDFDVPAAWVHRGLCGYDFLPMLAQHYWADAHCTNAPLPMYRECIVETGGGSKLSRNDFAENGDAHVGGYARWLRPEEKFSKPYALKDVCGRPLENLRGQYVEGRTDGARKEEYPFFLQLRGDRPSFFLRDAYPLADKASYWAWRAEHPSFIGVRTLGEYDQQSMWYRAFSGINKDPTVTEHLRKIFPFPPKGTSEAILQRDWFPKWVRECWARDVAFYFGETNLWTLCSGCPSLQHIMGEMGACGFSYEATTQGPGSWTVPGAITRGAARQFGVPFGWYGANYVTGYTRDGKWCSGEHSLAIVPYRHGSFKKNGGASRSLIRRQLTYGWLIGAALIDPENWYHYHMEEVAPNKFVPSVFAKDMQELVDRSKTTDRGDSYTPLAVLLPLWERHERCGWDSNNCDPWSANAVFLTLEPPNQEQNEKDVYDLARKNGDESCFFNSSFGGIYDVIAPDAQRTRATIAKTLSGYKAAIVAGDFRKEELVPRLFEDYAAAGGTLLVSADKLAKGVVDPAAAGVTFGKKTVESGKVLFEVRSKNEEGRSTSEEGRSEEVVASLKRAASGEATFQSLLKQVSVLSHPYDIFLPEGTPSARPLYTDENGTALVWERNHGRGRIVTVACDRMLPRDYATCARGDYRKKLIAAARPGFRFEIMHELLAKVQKETLPVSVEGDVMWGVNKVEVRGGGGQRMIGSSSGGALGGRPLPGDGRGRSPSGPQSNAQTLKQSNNSTSWLVWLMNNRGVKKFIGEPEELDASKTSTVTVRFGKESKTVTVGPGETKYVEFKE